MHAIDLVQKATSATSRLNKKFLSLLEHTKLILSKCPKCKHKCRFFQRDAGLVVFVFLIGVNEDQFMDNTHEEEVNVDQIHEDQPLESTQEDEEEIFDIEVEMDQTKGLDVALIKEESKIVQVLENARLHGSLPLP